MWTDEANTVEIDVGYSILASSPRSRIETIRSLYMRRCRVWTRCGMHKGDRDCLDRNLTTARTEPYKDGDLSASPGSASGECPGKVSARVRE